MNCANHLDRERVAFCQNCGKPLCSECTRTVGTAVFCEPCLAARLAAADTATSSAGTPYGYANAPYGSQVSAAVPPVPGAPNPALAGLLGLIPGVGAMYNGQYAKGIVHLIVFAVLVSLANSNGIFGLFVAGWIFYQVIEAHHTARARRDGTPLPNPFGLNDIGEKLGFGKSWPGAVIPPQAAPMQDTGTAYRPPIAPHFTQQPDGSQNFVASDGTHFTQGAGGGQTFGGPGVYGSSGRTTPSGNYVAPVPSVPPYGASFAVPEIDPTASRNRFPVGAILLIGFGILFFFGSSGWFHGFPVQRIIPFLLIGTGVWVFIQKMTNSGQGITDDGSPGYRLRLFRALRGSIWIVLVGFLFLLDTFDILSWSHSWPLFIIIAGLMTIFERSTYSAAASATPFPYPPYAAAGPSAPSSGPAAPSSTTSVVPTAAHNEEGS